MRKDFLWGGAVSAHQVEGAYQAGGKGLSIADVMTAGSREKAREITDGVVDMKWLIEQKVDFITTNEPVILQEELKKLQ